MKGISFLVLALFSISSCNGQENSTTETPVEVRPESTAGNVHSTPVTSDPPVLQCGGRNYTLLVESSDDSKRVIIREARKDIKSIELPTQSEVNGFSLNWAKQIEGGIEISIEYGSRFYYNKDFRLNCRGALFFLSEIRVTSFDKRDPQRTWKERTTRIDPEIPLETFFITEFIGTD